MTHYKAILFHPEGDYVTDFYREDKESVLSELENMGSRWIFYPISFVATEKTIVETPYGLEWMKGKRIKTIEKYLKDSFKNNGNEICEAFNEGIPLNCIY